MWVGIDRSGNDRNAAVSRKDLEVKTLYEDAMDSIDSIEINRSKSGWRVCWTVAGLAVVLVLWQYHRYGPRNSETVVLYFDRISFISKDGDSNFKYLVINPESWVPPEWRASSKRSRPDLYLRLDGKTVLFIRDVTKDELQEHFEHHDQENSWSEDQKQNPKKSRLKKPFVLRPKVVALFETISVKRLRTWGTMGTRRPSLNSATRMAKSLIPAWKSAVSRMAPSIVFRCHASKSSSCLASP